MFAAVTKLTNLIMNSTDRIPIELPRPLLDATMASTMLRTMMETMMEKVSEDPETLFKSLMGTLVAVGLTAKAWPYLKSSNWTIGPKSSNDSCTKGHANETKHPEVLSLQKRYLPVFYLFRMSFWMSGPYFYQVYSSKMLRYADGTTSPATTDFVARVSLVGYLAIVLLGPLVGRLIDGYGRKKATIITGALYALGSLSVFSDSSTMLYLGRAVASIASSRLTSAPESWLIREYTRIQEITRRHSESKKETAAKNCGLSETFGLAYGGDAVVAILAGQTACQAATRAEHPSGPFLVSPLFVTVALLLTMFFWAESKEVPKSDMDSDPDFQELSESPSQKPTIRAGAKAIFSDPKILLIGLVQSLFEGSMYIFVLVWPPVLSSSIKSTFGAMAITPFGTIFSCFMACCLLGSVLFGQLRKKSVGVKHTLVGVLLVSTLAFSGSVRAIQTDSLLGIISAFFAFEACVGMYFPCIGTIRSKIVPEKHRCAIMTLFAVPLNILVVGVISFQPKLGNVGSLTIASFAMGVAMMCMVILQRKLQKQEELKKYTLERRSLELAMKARTLGRRHSSVISLQSFSSELKAMSERDNSRRRHSSFDYDLAATLPQGSESYSSFQYRRAFH
jgi:MFS family permease